MVIYLKIIVLKECGKLFEERIKKIISQKPNIEMENYKESDYWKDEQLLEIEVALSTSIPLREDTWKELLNQIVNDYNVSQDKEYTTFEHFETVDMLKKGGESCFVYFNVPNGLIQEEL